MSAEYAIGWGLTPASSRASDLRMLQTLLLSATTNYVRHSPILYGKWRIALQSIAMTRRLGPSMGTRTVRTSHGFRMGLALADWVDQHIYATGEYEPDVLAVVKETLRDGMTAVDIGANVGFFSLLFATLVGQSGKVISFEPQPRAYDRMTQNLALNRALRVNLHKIAASDGVGEVSFYCGPEDHSGIASLRPLGATAQRIVVAAAPADSLLQEVARVDLIKIDVEGAEARAIKGLTLTLDRCRPDVIIEVSNRYLAEMRSSGRELCGLLSDRGYQMFQIGWNGLAPLAGWNDNLPDQFNALFTHQPAKFDRLIQR